MMTNQVEVIEKDGQPTHAVVPIDLYNRLLVLAEDAEDIRAANDALDELATGQDELVPAEVAHRLLQDEEPRLRIWREHRGLTQTDLGALSGVQQGYIAQIDPAEKPEVLKHSKNCRLRCVSTLTTWWPADEFRIRVPDRDQTAIGAGMDGCAWYPTSSKSS